MYNFHRRNASWYFFLAIRALMLILACQLFSPSDKQDFRPFYFTSHYTEMAVVFTNEEMSFVEKCLQKMQKEKVPLLNWPELATIQ